MLAFAESADEDDPEPPQPNTTRPIATRRSASANPPTLWERVLGSPMNNNATKTMMGVVYGQSRRASFPWAIGDRPLKSCLLPVVPIVEEFVHAEALV